MLKNSQDVVRPEIEVQSHVSGLSLCPLPKQGLEIVLEESARTPLFGCDARLRVLSDCSSISAFTELYELN